MSAITQLFTTVFTNLKRTLKMAKLAILDYNSTRVLVVDVCEAQMEKLENDYDNNTEDWLSEEGLDDKLEISINDIHYMWLNDSETIQNMTV